MNKELQELRSQTHHPPGPSRAQTVHSPETPNNQLTDEDAADNFVLDVSMASLEGLFLEASTAVQAFQTYVLHLLKRT